MTGTPPGGATSDGGPPQFRPIPRATTTGVAVGGDGPQMRPASGHQITEGDAQVPVQPADFGGIKRSCASPWCETRPPQHLIGDQIADTGEALLVKQTGFEGRS